MVIQITCSCEVPGMYQCDYGCFEISHSHEANVGLEFHAETRLRPSCIKVKPEVRTKN